MSLRFSIVTILSIFGNPRNPNHRDPNHQPSYAVSPFFSPSSRRVAKDVFGCPAISGLKKPPCDPNLQSPKMFWLFGFRVSSVKLWHPWRKPCRVVVEAPLLLMKPCPPLLISLTETPKIPILSFSRPSFFRVLANLPGCKAVSMLAVATRSIRRQRHLHRWTPTCYHRQSTPPNAPATDVWVKTSGEKTRNNNTVVK